MHGDLSKSAKDTSLEHSLFAAFNTDCAVRGQPMMPPEDQQEEALLQLM